MPHQRPKTPNLRIRSEGSVEQPITVQLLQPLAVLDVGLAPGDLVQMPCIHQHHLDPRRLQLLIERDPIHSGGLHGHRLDPTLQQPFDQLVQVLGKRPEAPNKLFPCGYGIERYARIVFGCSHINSCRMGIDHRHAGGRANRSLRSPFGFEAVFGFRGSFHNSNHLVAVQKRTSSPAVGGIVMTLFQAG
jgi:hypothetical protein